jgi:threonine dehydrogenase-like Zn-dependent dehydrogenase
VVYDGPRQVSVTDVPDARVERPTDVLVRITTTNICVTAAGARATDFCDTILQEFASGTGG